MIASKQSLEEIKRAIAEQADPARGERDRQDLEALRSLPDPGLPAA